MKSIEERAKEFAEEYAFDDYRNVSYHAYIEGAQSAQPEQTTLQAELSKMSYGDLQAMFKSVGESGLNKQTKLLWIAIGDELSNRIQHLIQLTKS